MTDDLLTEARHLAERGWLPGIKWDQQSRRPENVGRHGLVIWYATEADLHLAAHNEIVRRGWSYSVMIDMDSSLSYVDIQQSTEPGTTTLSLLKALRAACEEHERSEGAKR